MIGTVTYFPSGRFSLTRSYQWTIGINAGPYPTANPAPGVYQLFAPGAVPFVLYTFKVFDNFIPWSTTGFTLDHVLEECYYSFPPFTVNNPADVGVGVLPDPVTGHLIIRFGAFGYTGDAAKYPLPAAPAGYWNQPGFPS